MLGALLRRPPTVEISAIADLEQVVDADLITASATVASALEAVMMVGRGADLPEAAQTRNISCDQPAR